MIDRKFKLLAVNPCNGKIYTEDDAVVFCAKDECLPAALEAYKDVCEIRGCGKEHIESIELLIERVHDFQRYRETKLPDTETDCEIDRCIGGNV